MRNHTKFLVLLLALCIIAIGVGWRSVNSPVATALSDGAQALTIAQYAQLVTEVRAIHDVIAPAPVG